MCHFQRMKSMVSRGFLFQRSVIGGFGRQSAQLIGSGPNAIHLTVTVDTSLDKLRAGNRDYFIRWPVFDDARLGAARTQKARG